MENYYCINCGLKKSDTISQEELSDLLKVLNSI